jgi:pimeloyl-ACP methyl ester carboxylesterase
MKNKLAMPALGIGGRCNAAEMVAKAMAPIANNVASAVIEGAGHWVSDENPRGLADALMLFFAGELH